MALTCGAWMPQVARLAGAHVPIRHTHAEAFITEPVSLPLHNTVELADFYERIHGRDQAVAVGFSSDPHGALVVTEAVTRTEELHRRCSSWGLASMAAELLRLYPALADVVVVAAGGLETPVILQRSGVKEAGQNLSMDLALDTYGVTDGLSQVHEPSMALVNLEFHRSKGFLLSPCILPSRVWRFTELGAKGAAMPTGRLIGIMTKITDEPAGRVYEDGTISKPVTQRDWARLQEGSSISREILIKAGAKPDSLMAGKLLGGHPACTAAIGQIVDKDLQTHIDDLFVCDASVLPTPAGLPPILTIVALSKRLGKMLAV